MSRSAQTLTEGEYRRIRRDAVDRIAEAVVVDPPDDDVGRAIPGYVRGWMDDHYEDELGGAEPAAIEAAVPTDPDAVDVSASTPMSQEGGDEDHRRELYAARAVRADLTVALREHVDRLERAIAVHDALEGLVGARGGRADRRPSTLVSAFGDWVTERRGSEAGDRARVALTPLHVMRIDGLDVVGVDGDPAELGLLRAVEAWLRDEHPATFDPPPGVVE